MGGEDRSAPPPRPRPSSRQVVRIMTAALEASVSVGVDWGLPPGTAALPQLPTAAAVPPGGSARLYAAWLPGALGGTGWSLADARVVVRRGDGLNVRIPVAAAGDGAAAVKAGAVPCFETSGRNVAVLAVQVRRRWKGGGAVVVAVWRSTPSCLPPPPSPPLARPACVRSRRQRTAS